MLAAAATPPPLLRLAGHPLRWRLLRELGRSDRRVRELTSLVGASQSLVSYHLGQLGAGRLVTSRRSSADGRDAYYTLDLPRCAELLGAAGCALHPGLRLVAAPAEPRPRRASRPRVLFLCTGNSARSQLAEALLEQRSAGTVEARSAGSQPRRLHPNTVRVLAARGIDWRDRAAKHLSTFAGERFDCVVTLCDRVREVCPELPGWHHSIHWSIPDPAGEGETDEDAYPAFERVAAELETRIGFLLGQLEANAKKRA